MANKPGYYKEYYKKNREALIARSAETARTRAMRIRKLIRETKAITPCADCGVQYAEKPWRMSFDHLPEHEKLCNIAELPGKGWSIERVQSEIAKCDVVCLLCHADRTQQRAGSSNLVER